MIVLNGNVVFVCVCFRGVPPGGSCSPGEVLQVRRFLSDGEQPRLVLHQLLLALRPCEVFDQGLHLVHLLFRHGNQHLLQLATLHLLRLVEGFDAGRRFIQAYSTFVLHTHLLSSTAQSYS